MERTKCGQVFYEDEANDAGQICRKQATRCRTNRMARQRTVRLFAVC